MCFCEFIGYTCGHCSPGVVRPCPMTTLCHVNKPCPTKAMRPTMAPTMCPACSRITHSRSVLIVEWEHRFMHERGACGCAVIFPGLIGPRTVGAINSEAAAASALASWSYKNPSESSREGSSGVTGRMAADSSSRKARNGKCGRRKEKGKSAVSKAVASGCQVGEETSSPESKESREKKRISQTNAPALFQEVKYGEERAINIRLPSVYAAEWVNDHRQLRKCPNLSLFLNQWTCRLRLSLPISIPRDSSPPSSVGLLRRRSTVRGLNLPKLTRNSPLLPHKSSNLYEHLRERTANR